MPPETRYAKGPGGLVAYHTVGKGPPDLVWAPGTPSHIDMRWESPFYTRFFERLASFSRLILFDRRGSGLSDPVALDSPPTWEDWADDYRLVLDTVGSQRAAIFASLDAGPMAMLFAAMHPDRTSALLLANTTARWLAADDYPIGLTQQAADALFRFIEDQWGTEPFVAATTPSIAEDPRAREWFAKYYRACASPRVATALMRPIMKLDLRDVLSAIRVPTLVIHSKRLGVIPIEQGRYLAEHITGARLVELDSADSVVALGDADATTDAVEEFVTGVRRPPPTDRVLATVLFTDLVDSTQRATELGDRKWRELLDRHDEIARTEIERYRGRLWKSTGDGILATFDAPGRAIQCTLSLSQSVGDLGLALRAGLHAGEIELRGNDIGGIAVNIASRVSAIAGSSEILVSRTVADLVAGSGISFEDRGEHPLKGISGEWRIFHVVT